MEMQNIWTHNEGSLQVGNPIMGALDSSNIEEETDDWSVRVASGYHCRHWCPGEAWHAFTF